MRLATPLIAAGALLAGCGGEAPELFTVQRDGVGEGAALTLRVTDDGRVSCDGGPTAILPSERILDARELTRDLRDVAERRRAFPPRPGTTFRYTVELPANADSAAAELAFADTSPGLPAPAKRLQAFTRLVSKQTCGRER